MLFTSLTYFLFLIVTFGLTFTLPQRARVPFLGLASYVFYAYWKPGYALIILCLTVVNYAAALRIHRPWAWPLAIAANLLTFFVFKYLGFFTDEMNQILTWLKVGGPIPVLSFLLPLGISFHTLQAIAYVTDVKRRIVPAERSFIRFALFIAWFPQMIAGPIERASTLLVQLRSIERPDATHVRLALHFILLGLFKKLLIADSLGNLNSAILGDLWLFPTFEVWLAVYGFGLQLYFDFSAYMDIAKGSSLLFGVRLSENFNDPFVATSIPEFWRRWHISLTSWFFEYVYYPLIRRFPSGAGPYAAILAVFCLSGLWHGANWTFICWGLLHGILYCLAILLPSWRADSIFAKYVRMAVTFNLVCLCWVMFRAPSVTEALSVYARLLGFGSPAVHSVWPDQSHHMVSSGVGLVVLALLRDPKANRTALWVFVVLALMILTFGNFDSHTFIYFQF